MLRLILNSESYRHTMRRSLIAGGALIGLIWVCWGVLPARAIGTDVTADGVVVKLTHSDKLYTVPVSAVEDVEVVRDYLQTNPRVEFAEYSYDYHMAQTPNDPWYSRQPQLPLIGAPTAWDATTGSTNVVVAVLDTGVDIDHPDLASHIWKNSDETASNGVDDDHNGYIDDRNGWNFVNNNSDPNPAFDAGWTESGIHHGTAIAGVIGAVGNNATGITGVAWNVTIMPVRVLDSAGVGTTAAVYQGINYAVANGADIINLSFVGDTADSLLTKAINNAAAAGVLVVAAAGNEHIDLDVDPQYPVCNDHVIGVAGTTQSDAILTYTSGGRITGGSNYGTNCIDISAPATNYYSTAVYDPSQGLTDYYLGGWSGTSLASPAVAGSAALLLSYDTSLTMAQTEARLEQGTVDIDSLNSAYAGQMGAGRLDIGASLGLLLPSAQNVITGAGPSGAPHVRALNASGAVQSQFFAYAETFRDGVYVATGDVDGDGVDEIITGAGDGGAPHVRVFEQDGTVIGQFFAYATTFRGGVYVAAGDVDGDGVDEIITGAGYTGGPHVRVFDLTGNVLDQFFAYALTFRGGVQVAAGDVNGDGVDEIITGAGYTGAPHVRMFSQDGTVRGQFFAYDTNFRGGVFVSAGDTDGNGIDEIITGAGYTGAPHVRMFSQDGTVRGQFFAYATTFRGGVHVAVTDNR